MTEQHPITPPPELSPAAQALMEAYCTRMDRLDRAATEAEMVAAALRAAADQMVPEFWHEEGDVYAETKHDVRLDLLAIAAELEAQ